VLLLPLERMKLSRDDLFLRLREQNIGVSIHYPPLHKMQLYSKFCDLIVLPITEDISGRIITLPISASMELDDAEQVVVALQEAIT
jgi:dTDP-4-amino-4,6-dideoxygalactose transaminase